MENWIHRITYYYFIFLFIIILARHFPHLHKLLKNKKWREASYLRHIIALRMLQAAGFELEVKHQENVIPPKACIICANHASYLDIPVLNAALDIYLGYIGKAELMRLPILNVFFSTLDIPLHRADKARSALVFKNAMAALRHRRSLVIFPEGGIFPPPQIIKPFKDGAFQLAKKLGIPILTIGLPDNFKHLNDEKRYARKGKIRVILHEFIYPENFSVQELKSKVHNLLQRDLDEN